ncbi:MAG TPA: MFS transporter, partial [Pirellulales bacterium]
FGVLADRLPVRWLYPSVVLGWSAVGVLTGLASDYESMLVCRTLLGFFEAGHWPCALKTTQLVMTREKRLLGNSVLQSGGAIGAILTPLVIRALVGDDGTAGAWRTPFIVIGSLGAIWAMAWSGAMRSGEWQTLRDQQSSENANSPAPPASTFDVWWNACALNRRFWALVPMVICINVTWQLLRAWLPKFLQQGRGASEAESLFFNALYYAAADVGCLAAGAAGLWLAHRGLSVQRSRIVIVAACAVCTALTTLAATLPLGWQLYAVLLVIGAGAMGLFPCYYSLAQEVSPAHLGKVSGLLAALGWLAASPLQKTFGRLVDATGSFDAGLAVVGWAPALALLALVLIWPRESKS